MTKYGVVICDPPWRYANAGCRGAAENHYSTMSVAEMCALPVSNLAAENSVLFLWATWPLLIEALDVMKAWGFEYVSGLPWVKIEGEPSRDLWGDLFIKPQYGVGFWVRGCSEPLLIARRGTVSPQTSDLVGLLSPNFQHSRKPENVYHLAERLQGPYLEMFARRARYGWDSYGNEVAGSVILDKNDPSVEAGQLFSVEEEHA